MATLADFPLTADIRATPQCAASPAPSRARSQPSGFLGRVLRHFLDAMDGTHDILGACPDLAREIHGHRYD